MRKRHWHKVRRHITLWDLCAFPYVVRKMCSPTWLLGAQLFPGGPPSSAEEAHQVRRLACKGAWRELMHPLFSHQLQSLLRTYGSIDEAVAIAQRA